MHTTIENSTTFEATTSPTSLGAGRGRGSRKHVGHVSVRILAAVVVALTAVGATLTVDSDSASAATQQTSGGSPGYYTVGKIRSSVNYDAQYGGYFVSLSVDGPTVWRSPATAGPQAIVVATELWHWTTSGWRVLHSGYRSMTLNYGSVTSWPFTYNSLSPGHYFVRQYISWGGHGYVQVDYNQPSDYHCVGGSPARTLCTTYAQGWVYVHQAYR